MTLADLTIDHIASGGLTTAIAYAALQLGRGVTAVSTFLGKLGKRWEDEADHRKAEVEHWELVAAAIENHAEQQGQIIELLARPGVRAQA
jgi:hypothetical protein